MADPPTSWPAPAPQPGPLSPPTWWTSPPHIAPRRRFTTLKVALAVVILLAIPVSVGAIWRAVTPATLHWPSSVAPIAAYVAKDRGLAFKHVVPVHFQSPAVFDRDIAEQNTPDAQTRVDDVYLGEELRALGLLDGSVNISSAESGAEGGGVLGYYDPDTKAIYVRGSTLTPESKVTLAHELTHVLQDQYFGLNALDNRASTTGASEAVNALEEGDAVVEESDYVSTLPVKEQQQENNEENAGSGSSGPSGADILNVTQEVPYVLGPDFVQALYAAAGNQGINEAYRTLPNSELDYLDASAYLGRFVPKKLDTPALNPGEHKEGSPDEFGAFMLYMTLASRLPAQQALTVSDRWGGGSMVQYVDAAGQNCTRVDLVGQGPGDTTAIGSALSTWSQTMPGGFVTVSPTSNLDVLSACDPGSPAQAGPNSLEDALGLADERDSNVVNALYDGVNASVAGCVGDQALNDATLLHDETQANNTYGNIPSSLSDAITQHTNQLETVCEHQVADT